MSHRSDLLHQGRPVCILLGGSGTISACEEEACLSMIPLGPALLVDMRLCPTKARLFSDWPQMPHTCRFQCPARSLSAYVMALASLFDTAASKLLQWLLRSHSSVNLANKQGG